MVRIASKLRIHKYISYIAPPAGVRGPPADFLRNQCQKILSRMLRQASQRTKRFLQEMVKTSPLPELIDYFHAFLAFCVDPSSLLSPLSKCCHDKKKNKKEAKRKRNSYHILPNVSLSILR